MVSVILDCLAEGIKKVEILEQYLGLTLEDIYAAIAYGASLSRADIIPLH